MKPICYSLLFGILIGFAVPVSGQNLDINILKPINEVETNFKNDLTRITANSVAPLSLGIPLAFLADGLIGKKRERVQDALYIAAGMTANLLLTSALKKITDRPRPYVTWPFIVQRADVNSPESLPSQHSSFAFCAATSLSLRIPKWYVIVPSYFWAGTVAYSRMYQGVHYPSDVLLGAVIGAGSAWGAWKIQKCIQRRSSYQREKAKLAKMYF